MVGELLGLFSSFFIGIERALMLLILVTIALLSVSLVSVAVVFGIADLKKGITLLEERGKAGSVAQMLVSIFLILLTVGMEAVPISLFFVKEAAKMVLTQKAWVAIGAVAVAVLLVNACATAYALRKSIKSIGTLELN